MITTQSDMTKDRLEFFVFKLRSNPMLDYHVVFGAQWLMANGYLTVPPGEFYFRMDKCGQPWLECAKTDEPSRCRREQGDRHKKNRKKKER